MVFSKSYVEKLTGVVVYFLYMASIVHNEWARTCIFLG